MSGPGRSPGGGPSRRRTLRPPPLAFFDRDGTLIHDPGYLGDPAAVELLAGAAEAVALLNRLGVPVVVVTNQSGIGRGLYSEGDFWRVQGELEEQLAARGAHVDAVYYCPHDPRRHACTCRKPASGLFEQAARERGLALQGALFVGDSPRDLQVAERFGGTAVLVGAEGRSYDEPVPTHWLRAGDILDGVRAALLTDACYNSES